MVPAFPPPILYNIRVIKIGSRNISTNVFLAPLSGVSDVSFRLISREHGAKFCFFEMADSNSIIHSRPDVPGLFRTAENDAPIAAQILGSDPDKMLDAALKIMAGISFEFLDINAACPAKKVIKKKAGAFFLKNPQALFRIIEKLSVSLPIPVTVKLRLGYSSVDPKELEYMAKGCESSGASAIFLHGRTREQGYRGDIDYASIKLLKDSVKIPVFGSGNVLTPELAKKMLHETGCDGILVARGAFGNPWIFQDIEDYLNKGAYSGKPDLPGIKDVLKKHITYMEKLKESETYNEIGVMRKVAMWYMKGLAEAASLRVRICAAKNYNEILDLIDSL